MKRKKSLYHTWDHCLQIWGYDNLKGHLDITVTSEDINMAVGDNMALHNSSNSATRLRRIRRSRTCHLHFISSLANSCHFEMTDGCIKLPSFAIGFVQRWHLKWQSQYRFRHLKWQQFDREIARHFAVISNDGIFWQTRNDRLEMKWRWQVLDCRMRLWMVKTPCWLAITTGLAAIGPLF